MTDPTGGIHYTLKEVLDQINGQFKELLGQVGKLAETQDKIRSDFAGFEQRVKAHDERPGHAGTLERMGALEKELEGLQAQEAIRAALEEHLRGASADAVTTRRWLVSVTVALAAVLVSTLALILKVWGVVS